MREVEAEERLDRVVVEVLDLDRDKVLSLLVDLFGIGLFSLGVDRQTDSSELDSLSEEVFDVVRSTGVEEEKVQLPDDVFVWLLG